MIPFSEDELEYIARLDAEADMDLLRRELPSLREESLRTLQVATILLQRCAAAGDPSCIALPPHCIFAYWACNRCLATSGICSSRKRC